MLFHSVVEDYAYGMTAKDGIYIPDASYDMAQNAKGEGEANTHTFRIYNLRPRWLQVQAKPDCGCTGTSWENARITPFGWKDTATTMKTRKGQKSSVSIIFETDSASQKRVFAFLAS